MGIKLGKACPICNHDDWITIDNSDCFYILCGECTCEDSEENVNSFTIVKKDFVDNFVKSVVAQEEHLEKTTKKWL